MTSAGAMSFQARISYFLVMCGDRTIMESLIKIPGSLDMSYPNANATQRFNLRTLLKFAGAAFVCFFLPMWIL
jgi:hypothetical protein